MATNLILGGRHSDARGTLRFCNDFDMTSVRRFYTISNSVGQPIRGWIGHKRETKWFFPIKGKTVVEVKPMHMLVAEDSTQVELDAKNPMVFKVEPGNWFCIRQYGRAEVMVFSDCKVGEFDNDDYRRDI